MFKVDGSYFVRTHSFRGFGLFDCLACLLVCKGVGIGCLVAFNVFGDVSGCFAALVADYGGILLIKTIGFNNVLSLELYTDVILLVVVAVEEFYQLEESGGVTFDVVLRDF